MVNQLHFNSNQLKKVLYFKKKLDPNTLDVQHKCELTIMMCECRSFTCNTSTSLGGDTGEAVPVWGGGIWEISMLFLILTLNLKLH